MNDRTPDFETVHTFLTAIRDFDRLHRTVFYTPMMESQEAALHARQDVRSRLTAYLADFIVPNVQVTRHNDPDGRKVCACNKASEVLRASERDVRARFGEFHSDINGASDAAVAFEAQRIVAMMPAVINVHRAALALVPYQPKEPHAEPDRLADQRCRLVCTDAREEHTPAP